MSKPKKTVYCTESEMEENMGTLILFYTRKAFTWFQRTWNVAYESYKIYDILCSTGEISHTGLDGHDN